MCHYMKKIDVGVLLGSVLRSRLFIIHINDLQNSTRLKVSYFANDTLLYKKFKMTHIYKTMTTLI